MFVVALCGFDLCPSNAKAGRAKLVKMTVCNIYLVEGREDFQTIAVQCPDCGAHKLLPLTVPIEAGKLYTPQK